MTTTAAIADLLTRTTYRPGTTIRLTDDRTAILVSVNTIDSRDPDRRRPVVVQHRSPIPTHWLLDLDTPPPDYLTRWLFDQLLAVEEHEAAEWYLVDGAMPYDPHAR